MRLPGWLEKIPPREEHSSGSVSRRDFFARVAGRPLPANTATQDSAQSGSGKRLDGVLHIFHVAAFPYHDGPVIVPLLRPGLDFQLRIDAEHPTDPAAVRIVWGRDHLGYVPRPLSAEIRGMIEAGNAPRCRARTVDPSADLPHVLEVEILPFSPEKKRGDTGGDISPPAEPPP